LSNEFAFAIGGEVMPGEMTTDHLAQMARQLGMQPRFVVRQASEMAERLPAALAQAVQEVAPGLAPSAQTLAERLERFVRATTKKMAARLST
jgi:serine/threonine-protein kinase HipA